MLSIAPIQSIVDAVLQFFSTFLFISFSFVFSPFLFGILLQHYSTCLQPARHKPPPAFPRPSDPFTRGVQFNLDGAHAAAPAPAAGAAAATSAGGGGGAGAKYDWDGKVYKDTKNVFRGKCRHTGLEVIKKVSRYSDSGQGVPYHIVREVSILKGVDHDNVVRLVEVAHKEDDVSLIYEFLPKDLRQLLDIKREWLQHEGLAVGKVSSAAESFLCFLKK